MKCEHIMLDLKEAGWNHYRINKETGISYKTLRQWKLGQVKRPSLNTYYTLARLLNRVKGDTND